MLYAELGRFLTLVAIIYVGFLGLQLSRKRPEHITPVLIVAWWLAHRLVFQLVWWFYKLVLRVNPSTATIPGTDERFFVAWSVAIAFHAVGTFGMIFWARLNSGE